MLILLSPAKTLDMESELPAALKGYKFAAPELREQSRKIINVLKKFSAPELCELMNVSIKIGELNWERYRSFRSDFTLENSRPALLAFRGDVYQGLELETYGKADFENAQAQVRILSGLYGALRPLDLMQAYRLEMGTRLAVGRHKNLYEFWGDRITDLLNADLERDGSGLVINLASNEYFKSVNKNLLGGELITPVFKEKRGGVYKMVSVNAKRARGLMTNYLVKKRVKNLQQLLKFDVGGYKYNPHLSRPDEPIFTKD